MNCDANALMEEAKCFRCIPSGNLSSINTYLLCQWANSGVTPEVCQSWWNNVPNNLLLRNNFTGTLGCWFSVNFMVTVSRLGRKYFGVNSQDHPIGLWDNSAPALPIASGTILFASASDANGIKWVDVAPVILTPGKVYALGVHEFSAGDLWKDSWNVTTPSNWINAVFFNLATMSDRFTVNATIVRPTTIGVGTPRIYSTPSLCFVSAEPPPLITDIIFQDADGFFWKLIVSPDGNLGLESSPGPASPDLILDDGGGGMWKFFASTDGNIYTETSLGPAIPAPAIDDGLGNFWQVGVSPDGNFWASL